ncbi:cytochrome C oxidase subunit I [Sulfuricaulis limicola]|uniref:Cytochrome C oxidase subunit I n=1 Tax=Sulfuricaulis limicola TaxID=1620215 RepID=A0A1B4XD71_9GAMM|nr:SCO family protein [Sulfuricaulis limicola]BAV32732.1 cytochrome C oxidase subunit I [Sulfuricaulis limicola]
MTDADRRTASRRKILLLAALFTLPVIIAYALYFSGWRPASTGNHGELVQPARPIADAALTRLDGGSMRFSELHGKWTLITFSAAECLKPCERNLYVMRQVIAAQGDKAGRVQSMLVVTDPKALDLLRYTVKDYPGMRAIVGPPEAVGALARQFTLSAGSPLDNLNRVYLVDPLGNFMMSYPADADPNGIRKDLARLLRASRIG